jgi:hypothetical protein
MAESKQKRTGLSLATGPVGLIGMALLAYGVTALIFGGHLFTTDFLSGTVQGETWLGLEVNAWSSLQFIGAGALLLLGAPLHWGAKTMSLIVGLGLGAASVIALVDGDDVFGIFAANGLTTLVWGIAAAVLLVLALLPRVGGGKRRSHADADANRAPARRAAQPRPRARRQPRARRGESRGVAQRGRAGSRHDRRRTRRAQRTPIIRH